MPAETVVAALGAGPGDPGQAARRAVAGARIMLTSADLDHVPAEVMKTCAAVAFVAKQELTVVDLRTLFSWQPMSAEGG
jgi:hypothetical protein